MVFFIFLNARRLRSVFLICAAPPGILKYILTRDKISKDDKWKFAASSSSCVSDIYSVTHCVFCTGGPDGSTDYFVNFKSDTKLKRILNYLYGEKKSAFLNWRLAWEDDVVCDADKHAKWQHEATPIPPSNPVGGLSGDAGEPWHQEGSKQATQTEALHLQGVYWSVCLKSQNCPSRSMETFPRFFSTEGVLTNRNNLKLHFYQNVNDGRRKGMVEKKKKSISRRWT